MIVSLSYLFIYLFLQVLEKCGKIKFTLVKLATMLDSYR